MKILQVTLMGIAIVVIIAGAIALNTDIAYSEVPPDERPPGVDTCMGFCSCGAGTTLCPGSTCMDASNNGRICSVSGVTMNCWHYCCFYLSCVW